jgi:glycosyltransferase involved in cell wall biosynthesis
MLNENPQVSVVFPFHNAERWLDTSLGSLLDQRGITMEIIAIDDGSTDASLKIVRRAASSNSSIRLLQNEDNLGIVASLNYGLDAARGLFVARMDADDICMPDRLAHQVAFLEKSGCDICGSWFVEFGQGIPRMVRWPHTESALRAAMLFQNTICHPTVMARREVFKHLRYREEYRLVEDYDLFGRACGDFRMANVPEPLLRYRRHSEQVTQSKRDAMEMVTKRIRLEVLERQGFKATADEQRLHNLIRAPYSIRNLDDLRGIEAWLIKLHTSHRHEDARLVIASQWIRAYVRAAPLGKAMWRTFCASPLRTAADVKTAVKFDLALLAAAKFDYRSAPFAALRRFGLSV